jgi:hypothetical protein
MELTLTRADIRSEPHPWATVAAVASLSIPAVMVTAAIVNQTLVLIDAPSPVAGDREARRTLAVSSMIRGTLNG